VVLRQCAPIQIELQQNRMPTFMRTSGMSEPTDIIGERFVIVMNEVRPHGATLFRYN
jgi:hypothetical protein